MTEIDFENRVDGKVSFYLIIIVGLCSLIFLNEQIIQNNTTLSGYADIIVSIFPSFELFALKSQYVNLYYFAKFQISLSFILLVIITFVTFKNIIKIYKCSWGDSSYDKSYYFSEKINKNGFFFKRNWYIGAVVFIILFILYYFFGLFFGSNPQSADVLPLKFIYNTKLGITAITMIFAYFFGTLFPKIVMETIGRIKYYRK